MKYIIAVIAIILVFSLPTKAQVLTFDEVLDQAIEHSYELQISKMDIGISEAGVKEARSEYFPTINLGYNAGYQRDLSDNNSPLTPVGDSILLNETQFRNSASANLQYNLFDFGARGKKLKIAKKDREQKNVRHSMNMRNLKMELAETYTKVLLNYKELKTNTELLNLNNELFKMQERLHKAGKVPKTEMMEQAIAVARITGKIDEIRTEYQKNLEDLTFYTGREYNPDDLELNYIEQQESGIEKINLETPGENIESLVNTSSPKLEIEAVKTDFLDIENLPEYEYYQLEIEKKQAELAVLNSQRLPHFMFHTGYYLYGADKNSYWDTFSDMGQTNLSFRIASTLPVFTGFKNTAQRDRAKLEIEKLKLQRDKKIEEVKNFYQKMYKESKDYDRVLSNQEKSLELVKEKILMLDRLDEQKLIDKVSYLKQKAELTSQKLELEKVKISNSANEYKLNVMRIPEEEQCKQD